MAMASKRRLTSTDGIELCVVFKFCVELKVSPVETLKQIQNAPLQIVLTIQNWKLTCLVSDFHCTCHTVQIQLHLLGLSTVADLTKKLYVDQWFA